MPPEPAAAAAPLAVLAAPARPPTTSLEPPLQAVIARAATTPRAVVSRVAGRDRDSTTVKLLVDLA